MPRLLSLALLGTLVPHLLLGQSTRSRKSKPVQGTPQEYVLVQSMNEVVGKLATIDKASSGSKALTLHLPYTYSVTKSNRSAIPNPGYVPYAGTGSRQASYQSQLATLEQQHQKALSTKNPIQREQKLAQIAAKMQQLKARLVVQGTQQQLRLQQQLTAQANRLFGAVARKTAYVAVGYKIFDLESTDKLTVRRLNPPVELDKKGNPKKHTAAELDRLKGKDKTLPGYEASLQDLQSGQMVKAFLAQTKPAKKAKKDEAAAKEGPGKKDAAPAAKVDLPRVSLIMILVEADD
jgi:hypothetical protein